MKNIYPPGPNEIDGMTSGQLRESFLVQDLFAPGEARLVNTGLDRIIVGGIAPDREIVLPSGAELHARFFHERRESGIINIGDPGEVTVDGNTFALARMQCVYVGMGAREISFRSGDTGQAAFYFVSSPAHHPYPTRRATIDDTEGSEIGNAITSSRRTIHRCIHQDGIRSCQLVMGWTHLKAGSVWNTWPPHTHDRRSEVYLYTELGDNVLMHFMGVPERTRHLVVRDRQAVLSPPWSIHCGAGTVPYAFIWAMAGENQAYADMDPVDPERLR
jgi:4-deoxy-L-threo-5-hexosulose-uronate ketol-isomerase